MKLKVQQNTTVFSQIVAATQIVATLRERAQKATLE